MSEDKQVVNESVEEVTTKNESQDQPVSDDLIAESKKYRKRAQDAETRLAKLEAKFNDQENVKLKEKEEFKTLAEKLEADLNETMPYKEKYEAMVNTRKESLLLKLPEDQRENFKSKDLDVLEFMVEQLSDSKAQEPSARGSIKTPKITKDWTKMDAKERRANWKDTVASYVSRK